MSTFRAYGAPEPPPKEDMVLVLLLASEGAWLKEEGPPAVPPVPALLPLPLALLGEPGGDGAAWGSALSFGGDTGCCGGAAIACLRNLSSGSSCSELVALPGGKGGGRRVGQGKMRSG